MIEEIMAESFPLLDRVAEIEADVLVAAVFGRLARGIGEQYSRECLSRVPRSRAAS
jgi:hypothetical protein